jgi:hypothetical protein
LSIFNLIGWRRQGVPASVSDIRARQPINVALEMFGLDQVEIFRRMVEEHQI